MRINWNGERMRRPNDVELPEFWDKLEHELREQIRINPPRRSRVRKPRVSRFFRAVAKPALHGGMAVVMAAVLFLAERPASSEIGLNGPDSGAFGITTAAARSNTHEWVAVLETVDPQPAYLPRRIARPKPRFVRLIPSTVQATEPLPDLNILARV